MANFNLTILRIFSNYLNRATPLPDGRRGHMIDLDRLDPTLLALLSVADVTLLAVREMHARQLVRNCYRT